MKFRVKLLTWKPSVRVMSLPNHSNFDGVISQMACHVGIASFKINNSNKVRRVKLYHFV